MYTKSLPIAIVEDSDVDALRLEEVWISYCNSVGCQADIKRYLRGEDFIQDYHHQFDLVFMDIDLPGGDNGIKISEKLRKIDPEITLVIISNVPKYAIDGYEVKAVDFILKPISPTILLEKMKRISNIIKQAKNQNINIQLKNNKIIKSKDIMYVEVMNHNINFHTKDSVITCRGTLKEITEKLSTNCFSRISYSVLLNLNYVASVGNLECRLTNGQVLYISRNRKKEFFLAFSRYLGGSL